MSTKYELTITKDYTPTWGVTEAIRELFQNALDQETVNPDNTMFFDYDNETLRLGNSKSTLTTTSLVLGATTKSDNDDTIGKFGEGYKIATLVLTRLGKNVTFYNYGAREVWYSSIEYSRKYKTELLTFRVDKKFPWNVVPDNDLTIEVGGISEDEYEFIVESNLHMLNGYGKIETSKGEILIDSKQKGKVYVNGLYVNTVEGFDYGYNFKPKMIELDRDRKMVTEFDLKWTTSQLWLEVEDTDVVIDLVESESKDVSYIIESNYSSKLDDIADTITSNFINKYGIKAVPVTSQSQAEEVPSTHKAVIVNNTTAKLINQSTNYIQPIVKYVPTFVDNVDGWLSKYGKQIKREARRELEQLIKGEKEMEY